MLLWPWKTDPERANAAEVAASESLSSRLADGDPITIALARQVMDAHTLIASTPETQLVRSPFPIK